MRQPVPWRIVGVDDLRAVDVGGIFQSLCGITARIRTNDRRRFPHRRFLCVVGRTARCQSNQKKNGQTRMPPPDHSRPLAAPHF